MRPDDLSSAQRVSRLLDLPGQPPEPPGEDDVWPAEWPPGSASAASAPSAADRASARLSGAHAPPGRLGGLLVGGPGPRRQVPLLAALAVAVLALVVIAGAVLLALRGPAPDTLLAPPGQSLPQVEPSGLPAISGPVGLGGSPTVGGSGASAGASSGFNEANPGLSAVGGATAGPAGSAGTSAPGGQFRVYVVGQVRRPGVVSLAADARVEDAVQAAGGPTAKADLAVMNLARRIVDGERILVPRPGEKLPPTEPVAEPGAPAPTGEGGPPGAPVDLNTATVAQLDALPGIGPVLAGRIVSWRQENGRFTRVDDLGEVQGIGAATLEKLRPLVRV